MCSGFLLFLPPMFVTFPKVSGGSLQCKHLWTEGNAAADLQPLGRRGRICDVHTPLNYSSIAEPKLNSTLPLPLPSARLLSLVWLIHNGRSESY